MNMKNEELISEQIYNNHYIVLDSSNNIIDRWSDGLRPEKDTTGAICINERGSYQFRLYPDGEENPPIYTMDGIPMYKWDGERVVLRTEEEIESDRAAIPEPPPSPQEQLRADIDFIAIMTGVNL